jgi:transcriptional regulator with XRE-family HTH domain
VPEEDSTQRAQLAALIRRARKMRDMTVNEAAEAAGVAPGTIVRVEKGEPIRPGNLLAIRTALGIVDVPETRPVDDDVQLALDIVGKALYSIEDDEARHQRAREIIRFVTLRDGI